jgi:uncharacterized membrane protein YadS
MRNTRRTMRTKKANKRELNPMKLMCIAILIAYALMFLSPYMAQVSAGTDDVVKPLYDEATKQWDASGKKLIALLAVIVGLVALVISRRWEGLVLGILIGVLAGSAVQMSGCAIDLGNLIGQRMVGV